MNLMTRKRYIISIHAPRTGRDGRQLCGRVRRGYFNPRSPHGERRCPALRPIRRRHFNPRSPHGERHLYPRRRNDRRHFNPRSPHGERPDQEQPSGGNSDISTHAPRTGSDSQAPSVSFLPGTYFNPRSPHGERPRQRLHCPRGADFNPRSPHGERHSRDAP